jgi:hypothetical protein
MMKFCIMKNIVFILILSAGFNLLPGQTTSSGKKTDRDCSTVIKDADKQFQEGLYDKCINNLEGILKTCSLSRSEKEHAMELLAKAYVETDELGKAESTVNIMLINFPHYELKEADNSEAFNRLVKKYKVHPLLSIGIRNTAKWINFTTSRVFSVLDGLDYSQPYIHQGFAFMYYGWGEIEFDKDISFNGDLILMLTNYDRKINKAPGFSLEFWENNQYIEIPVYMKKYFHIGKNVLPYITAGMGWLYMLQAVGNEYLSYTKDDIITGKNADFNGGKNNINMMEMRNKSTFEWLAGTGIGYKLKNLRLFLDVRYYGGLNSFTNAAKRLSNTTLINDYFYVDNSVKLNQFEIGASISYTLINSVKRTKH